jgi:hypothetical protein
MFIIKWPKIDSFMSLRADPELEDYFGSGYDQTQGPGMLVPLNNMAKNIWDVTYVSCGFFAICYLQ